MGLLKAELAGAAVVFDAEAETIHVLSPLASYLLATEGARRVDEFVDEFASATALTHAEAEFRIREAVATLRSRRLLDHVLHPVQYPLIPGSTSVSHGNLQGTVHSVVDCRIAFRSSNRELLDEIDDFLGGGQSNTECDPNILLDVELDASDGITLTAADVWPFRDREAFFRQLVDVLNEYAVRGHSTLALHAGAVRTPDGRILLLAGDANSGKSTLTAALIQAGCDYLGDDIIGVHSRTLTPIGYPKPISLDKPSRQVLGLPVSDVPYVKPTELRAGVTCLAADHGSIAEVVLPLFRFDQGARSSTRLDPTQALKSLLTNTLNLGRSGQAALETVCRLAEEVPVTRIEHDDAVAVAAYLVAGTTDRRVGVTVRGRHPIDDFKPNWATTHSLEHVAFGDDEAALLRTESGRTLVLDGLGSALWPLLDGQHSVASLVDLLASQFDSELDMWHLLVEQLRAMAELDLIAAPHQPWPLTGTRARPSGPWQHSEAWLLRASKSFQRQDGGAWASQPIAGFSITRWTGDRIVATNSELVRAAFQAAIDSGIAVEVPEGAQGAISMEGTVDIRKVRGGTVVRVGSGDPFWVPPGDEVEAVALLLCNMGGGQNLADSVQIAPVWTLARDGKAVLFLGDLPGRDHPRSANGSSDTWLRRLGMRIEHGRVVWVPDCAQAESWLREGADPQATSAIWTRYDVKAVGVGGAPTEVDGLVAAVDTLAPWSASSTGLTDHLLGGSDATLYVGPTEEVLCHLTQALGMDTAPASKTASRPLGFSDSRTAGDQDISPLKHDLGDFGSVTIGDQSAKVGLRHVRIGRPLVKVTLRSPEDVQPGGFRDQSRLSGGFASLGLEPGSADEVAGIVEEVGAFYVGEERSPDGTWRRKLYVNRPTSHAWRSLASLWPPELTSYVEPQPSWLAWKFSSSRPHEVRRAIDVPRLGGVSSIAEAAEPVLVRMPESWAEVVRALLDRAGARGDDRPRHGDALTVEEGGRYSIDIEVRPVIGRGTGLSSELRWLVAAAGHDASVSEDLVGWAEQRRLANVIFGTDERDEPFVNLYFRTGHNS